MEETQILSNLNLLPYHGIWETLQKQAEEEEKKKKKKREEESKPKPEPVPPSLKIDPEIIKDLEPQPLDVPVGPKSTESVVESLEKQRKGITQAQFERSAQISPPPSKPTEQIFLSRVKFFDFNPQPKDVGESVKPKKQVEELPKENRILAVLRGEPDPIWDNAQYQKILQLNETFEKLRQQQLEQKYESPTSINWIDSHPEVDIETIKKGVAAGELFVRTGEVGRVAYYKKDPKDGKVTKDYVEIPMSFFVYGLVPRRIEEQEYRVPTLKPLYYIDREGNVRRVKEGILKETAKSIGTQIFGQEKWDQMLMPSQNLTTQMQTAGKQEIEDYKKVPYLPKSWLDAVLGISTNLPFSNRVIMEPGGEPTEFRPNQPIYFKTQPYQEIINKNPYTWAEYGLGNLVAPLVDLPKLVTKEVPQFPVTMAQIGEEATPEEIQKFKDKLSNDEILSAVYNAVIMLPAGMSKVLTGTLALSYMAQPLTSSYARPIESRVAESLLNGALFLGLGKVGKAGKYIREGKPVPVKVIAQDAGKRLGLMVGGEAFRHTFFVPYQSEEDAWEIIKPYVYTLGIGLMFEAYGLKDIVKHNRYLKRNLPPEIYNTLKGFVEKYPKTKQEDINRIIEETKKNIDTPEEAKAVQIVEESLRDAQTIAEDIFNKLQNKIITVEEATKQVEEVINRTFEESFKKAKRKERTQETQEPASQQTLETSAQPQEKIAPIIAPESPVPTEISATRARPKPQPEIVKLSPKKSSSQKQSVDEEAARIIAKAQEQIAKEEADLPSINRFEEEARNLPPVQLSYDINKKIGGLEISRLENRADGEWYVVTPLGKRIPINKLSTKAYTDVVAEIAQRMINKGEIAAQQKPPQEKATKGEEVPAKLPPEEIPVSETPVSETPIRTLQTQAEVETPQPPKEEKAFPATQERNAVTEELASKGSKLEDKGPTIEPTTAIQEEPIQESPKPAFETEPAKTQKRTKQTQKTAKKDVEQEIASAEETKPLKVQPKSRTLKIEEEEPKRITKAQPKPKTKTTEEKPAPTKSKKQKVESQPQEEKTIKAKKKVSEEATAQKEEKQFDIQLKYDFDKNDVVAVMPDGKVVDFFTLPKKVRERLKEEYKKVYAAGAGSGELYSTLIPGLGEVIKKIKTMQKSKEAERKLEEGSQKAEQQDLNTTHEIFNKILFDVIKTEKQKDPDIHWEEFSQSLPYLERKALKLLKSNKFDEYKELITSKFGPEFEGDVSEYFTEIGVESLQKTTTSTQTPANAPKKPVTGYYARKIREALEEEIVHSFPSDQVEAIKGAVDVIAKSGLENKSYDQLIKSINDVMRKDVSVLVKPIVEKYQTKLNAWENPTEAQTPSPKKEVKPRVIREEFIPLKPEEIELEKTKKYRGFSVPQNKMLRHSETAYTEEGRKQYAGDLPVEQAIAQELIWQKGRTYPYLRYKINNLYDDEVVMALDKQVTKLLGEQKGNELERLLKKRDMLIQALNPTSKYNVKMENLMEGVRDLSITKFRNHLLRQLGPTPREEFVDSVLEGLRKVSDKYGKLNRTIVKHEAFDEIKHQMSLRGIKPNQHEEKLLDDLWDIIKKQKPILGTSKFFLQDQRLWGKVEELHRLYNEAIEELQTKGPTNLPTEIFVRARELMFRGYKNPYYILHKLYEEFPNYPGHLKPSIQWLERQIKLNYAHRPYKPIPFDDFASFSSKLDALAQEYINEWRPSEVLYHMFGRELTPKEKARYWNFLETSVPDILRTNKPLIFDYLKGTLQDKSLQYFTEFLKHDLYLHKDRFQQAVNDFIFDLKGEFQNPRLRKLTQKYENFDEMLGELFAEIYKDVWYKPIKTMGEKIIKQYENFDVLLAKLDTEFPFLIDGYIHLNQLANYHEGKFAKLLNISKNTLEAFGYKKDAIELSLKLYEDIQKAKSTLNELQEKYKQYRDNPDKADRIKEQIESLEQTIKEQEKSFINSVIELKEIQQEALQLIAPTKTKEQTSEEAGTFKKSDTASLFLRPSSDMAAVYEKLALYKKGKADVSIEELAKALQKDYQLVTSGLKLYQSNEAANKHKQLAELYKNTQENYLKFLRKIAVEFQQDPTGGFLWDEAKLGQLKEFYEQNVPVGIRRLIQIDLEKKGSLTEKRYSSTEGFKQFKEFLEDEGIQWNRLDVNTLKEAILEELKQNKELRQALIERFIESGFDPDRIFLKMKAINTDLEKQELWNDFNEIAVRVSQKVKVATEEIPEGPATPWEALKSTIDYPEEITGAKEIKSIIEQWESLIQQDVELGISTFEEGIRGQVQLMGTDFVRDIIYNGKYIEKGFDSFYKDWIDIIDTKKEWKKAFEESGINKSKLREIFKESKEFYDEIITNGIEKEKDIDVNESKLNLNPLSLLWASSVVAYYVLPDDQKELKKVLLYSTIGLTGGYLGYRAYQNYKRFKTFTLPPLSIGELNHRISSALPYMEAVRKFGPESEAVKKVANYLKEIHINAEKFTGAPLAIQAKTNPLAKKIYKNIKNIEIDVNQRFKNLNGKAQKFLNDTPDEILGVISAASIQTQRDLYQLRSAIRLGKTQKIKPDEYEKIKNEMLRKNIEKFVLEMGVKKNPGKSLSEYAGEIFEKAQEYRSILRDATEFYYRNVAAKLLKIPVNRQDQEYQQALIVYEQLQDKMKSLIQEVKAKRKDYKELQKMLLKNISNISPEAYATLTSALLSNPRINKILKENPGLTPEDLLAFPQFRRAFEYAKNRLEETKFLRKEIALKLKAIESLMKENYNLAKKLEDYKKIYKEEIKYIKQIITILNPDRIQKYLDKSENVIFWNPLWNRTFGDYGVKIESYEHKNGEPIAPLQDILSPTKIVYYALKPEGARTKALEFLQQNGYKPHPKYSDVWIKYKDQKILDLVRVVEFNKKELDVVKRHIPKFVEDLNTYYGALGKAYQKLVKEKALSTSDIEIIRELQNKIKEFIKQHQIDPAEVEEGEIGTYLSQLQQLANVKAYNTTTLGTFLRILQTTNQLVPMMRYRDYVGYETSKDPLKEASLFKYALLNHLDKMREQGLQFNVYAYVNNDVGNFILKNNLITTRFASYMQNLQNDLMYSPTNMYEGGLMKVGKKVFDARRLIDNLSSLAFFNVFFGNISAAYRNLKYNLLANTVNQISEGKGIGETIRDFLFESPVAIKDFFNYLHTKYKAPGETPVISNDPVKQKTFEILYNGGIFTQSVLDALSTSAASIKLRDWFNLPSRKTDWVKLLAFKLGFMLQRNSEVLNKLIDFEVRYNHLRRRGIDNPQQLASEIVVGLGQDVGFYQLHDLGEITRYVSRLPVVNIVLHMMKPGIIQNYNYLETLRIPYIYFKEKLKGKENKTYTYEQAVNYLKGLGALSVLTTLLAGWRGVPLLGDLFDFLDKSAQNIDKSNPKFDPKGLQKFKYQLQTLCNKSLGISHEDFEKYWMQLMYGIDSYFTGRNVSINNLLGPFLEPFLIDYFNRQLVEAAKNLGKGQLDTDFFLPAGIKKIQDYLKTISAGNILIKGKYFDYETGRELTIKDYLFGYLGTALEDVEIRYLQGKGYYEFITQNGRKDFYKKTLSKMFAGSYKTMIVQRLFNYISLNDPEFKKAPDIYLTALDIYKNKYLDYVVNSSSRIEKLFKEKSEKASQLIRKLKDVDEEFGKSTNADEYVTLLLNDVANYYQILALNEAYRIHLGFKGNFDKYVDDVYQLKNYDISEKGYKYAINKRILSKKSKQHLEDLQEFFFYPLEREKQDTDLQFSK